MAEKKPPCFNCKKRQAGCHAQCERYQKWSEERQTKTKAQWKLEQATMQYFNDKDVKVKKLTRQKFGPKGRWNKNA